MGSEENRAGEGDGVGLAGLVWLFVLDFMVTDGALLECRRGGCPKREKALLKKKWVGYVRWVRKIVREAVGNG
jgi:hypothetical protein